MSNRPRRGASAELYFQSQQQLEDFRALAASQGLSLSTLVRQLLNKAQAEVTGD